MAIGIIGWQFKYYKKQLASQKRKTHNRLKICRDISNGIPLKAAVEGYRGAFPKQFDNLPLSNNEIVLDVKKLDIRNVAAPYNASLIEIDNGYLVFFRYDIVKQMHLHLFHTYIGCAELDKNFKQTDKEFVTIDMKSNFAEDPRVVKLNNSFSLIYNNLVPAKFYSRAMHIANVDFNKQEASKIEKIDLLLGRVEKNWAPFIYQAEDVSETIHFEYQLVGPRKILKYNPSSSPKWVITESSKDLDNWCAEWSEKWGPPLGGTGARLIGEEYVSFFHSKFKAEDGAFWYVMGAYTFEAKPPFRITSISTAPILFNGIYETPALNTASPDKFVIFPCGFAVERREEKTLIHLGCGENDSAIKILTIDKDALLRSLKKIKNDEKGNL